MKKLTFSLVAIALTLLTACKDGCNATDATCSAAASGSKTFAVLLTSAPANLGAIIFDVSGGGKKMLLLATDAAVKGQAGATTDQTTWRGVLLGKPTSARIGTITLDAASTTAPNVIVVEAAANASGNFMPIASSTITLSVQRTN
ncbi:MAG: hypothetical protein ABJC26_10770 [Gemmatimonadaceae bacterium]